MDKANAEHLVAIGQPGGCLAANAPLGTHGDIDAKFCVLQQQDP